MTRIRVSALLVGSAVAALLQPAGAYAQPETEATVQGDFRDAIVVTARRRAESAQNVPIALTALSNAQIAVPGAIGLAQVAQLAPSLQITATNVRQTNINIRGLGATPAYASLGLEYGVGVYIDQIYYSRPTQAAFDLYDLEQVEVLRGPQGTLFGKNTTAGAIHITTQAPGFEPEFRGELSLGNYRSGQLRATGSIPLTNTLAARITISNTLRDKGFMQHATTGQRYSDLRTFSVRGQLLFTPQRGIICPADWRLQ